MKRLLQRARDTTVELLFWGGAVFLLTHVCVNSLPTSNAGWLELKMSAHAQRKTGSEYF